MHRVHDYQILTARWRAVCRAARLRLRSFGTDGKHPLLYVRSPALRLEDGIYISAGIHGDEPAGAEALVTWAERNTQRLATLPLILFPCLNPWGLIHNSRYSEAGLDLNRAFQREELPLIAGLKRLVANHWFDLSLTLHEDFDGEGLYLYEIQRVLPYWGESLLAAARPIISAEPRPRVDGWKAAGGIIRRRLNRARFERIGYPEAAWLHLRHSERTFTVETPSEFALSQRTEAHIAVIEECVRLVYASRGAAM